MRALPIVAVATALTLAPAAVAQAPPSLPPGVVITVGTDQITQSTYDHWTAIAHKDAGGDQHAEVSQFLISAHWILGEAAVRGIVVTDEQVKRSFAQTKKESFSSEAAFQRFLKRSGMTVEDLLFRVRVDEVSSRLRRQVVGHPPKATIAEELAYYKHHKFLFATPRRWTAIVVRTSTRARALRLLAAARNGHSLRRLGGFASTASSFGYTALTRAIAAATPGTSGGPIKVGDRYAVFTLEQVLPARPARFRQARVTIAQLIPAERAEALLEDFLKDFQRRWKTQTVCANAVATKDCGSRV